MYSKSTIVSYTCVDDTNCCNVEEINSINTIVLASMIVALVVDNSDIPVPPLKGRNGEEFQLYFAVVLMIKILLVF